jgi:hypothetical protein
VIGTYAAVIAVCGAALAIGQAAVGLSGHRGWSWLSPAVGLALVLAVCWATVRLPGDGVISALAILVLVVASVFYLWGRLAGGAEAWRFGWPVALGALLAASLPFAVEGHFGILGTSFNPDMSQHLLAAARLAEGQGSQLLHQGYPLGPHATVVALDKGLGVSLVQGFGGLSVAVLVLASLTALGAFARLRPIPRTAAALVVGFAYVVASYFAQGAFKEVIEAFFVLAFALALRESSRPDWSELPLRYVPAALIAVGAVYAYSFPGLLWLGVAAVVWALAEYAVGGPETPPNGWKSAHQRAVGRSRLAPRPVLLALLVFAVLVLPELGRMVDFKQFETFDPNGPGLGNLFGQVSPFEALGIWPSGDFRLAPGDGVVPASGYYLGAAYALVLLVYGVARGWRRRELAILAALGAAAIAYLGARVGGTAYTAAKAIEIAAPLASLTILLGLLGRGSEVELTTEDARGRGVTAPDAGSAGARPASERRLLGYPLAGLAAAVFLIAAGACSLLALANTPVGPTSYSPALTGLRPLVAADSTLVLASDQLLSNEHGTPFIAWELRGGRVCIESESEAGGRPPTGVRFVITRGDSARPPYPGLRLRRLAPPYVLWEVRGPVAARSPCPLIAVRQARQGPAR